MSNENQCLICKKCFMSPRSLDKHMHKAVPCEPKHHKRMVFMFDPFDLRVIAARQEQLEEMRLRRREKEAEHERIMADIRAETDRIIARRRELEVQTAKLQQELETAKEAMRSGHQSSGPVEA